MVWCDSAVVLETCIQALGEMDADVVVGAGHQELPPLLPANFIPLPYAPGQALARRADVLIHHGGHGSTLTALAAGTPALIIPTYSERESNARRAAALGAALYLVPETQQCGRQHEQPIASSSDLAASDRKLEPARVADAITTLLAHSRYADSAKTAAKELAALPGASGAADIIEAVAPATSSRRRQRIAGASDSLRRG